MALAVCKGHERIVQMLQGTGHLKAPTASDCFSTPSLVCHVIYTGNTRVIEGLIDATGYDGSSTLLTNRHWTTHICQSGRNRLATAIWSKNMRMIEFLLKVQDIDLNAGGLEHTPIREAVVTSNAAALRLLVESEMIHLPDIEIMKLRLLAKHTGFDEAISILDDYSCYFPGYVLRRSLAIPPSSRRRWGIIETTEIDDDSED
jgi:hypothetical protein